MGDTGKFRIPPNLHDTGHLDDDEHQEPGPKKDAEFMDSGQIEYDELGNPVWKPFEGLGDGDAIRRLLDDDSLAITDDHERGTVRKAQPNPAGVKKGYNPYDSDLLVKKEWKKTKDLRALSDWITRNKNKPKGR